MRLGFLRPLYQSYGDFVSVYLDVSRAAEDAAHAVELRWRSARERLAAQGADRRTLDAVGATVTDPANAAPGIAVFARHGTVALRARLRTAPASEIARFAALPHVMPLLAQHPPRVPHLRVTARRAGGEVLAVTATGRVRDEWRARGGWPLHKSSEGQTSNQHGPEAEWDANAREIAAHVASAAADVQAERVVVAGDPRARSALLDHLKPALREMTETVAAEVPADSAAMAEAAEKITDNYAERAVVSRFATWQSRIGDGITVAGLAETVAALADGRAAEVFVAGDPALDTSAWTGPGATELALTPQALSERGVAAPVRDRADAAIARAIACTDAELFFMPGDSELPAGGIGATLRYLGRLDHTPLRLAPGVQAEGSQPEGDGEKQPGAEWRDRRFAQ